MTRPLLFALALLTLAGCGGGGGGGMVITPPPGPQRIEDQFGAGFALSFRKDGNLEPREPAPGDAGELSLTTEPREP